ncbi:MAG: N-6 DNA methylase [Planctomycetes bacterium]|nr:N-6 DNA methylase [Planctomycetota bacterium]
MPTPFETDLKKKIEGALEGFKSESLLQTSMALLGTLGYKSKLKISLRPNNSTGFLNQFGAGRNFSSERAKTSDWKIIEFLFQITKDEINFTAKAEDDKFDEKKIESYLFFAVELKNSEYSRSDLVAITREVNKLFDMPAMLIFKYGGLLTISVIDRRPHRREGSKDVLEKVTLIKDISFLQPHRGHTEILYDLSLNRLRAGRDFSSFGQLHDAWKKVLSSSELNKKFYTEVSYWYFWAQQKVKFPKDAGKNEEERNSISLIRLITRLIFVWFIKEKGLIPSELFEEQKLKEILNFKDHDKSAYYKAVLQNLFFACLNTEMDKREFRKESKSGGRASDYMVHNRYRYRKYFDDPDRALELFKSIPFVNGGLFECLDRKDDENDKEIRIDGFSDTPMNQPCVPDELFFRSEPLEVDISEFYENQKIVDVRGLIEILKSYKFTVAENTPLEEEVALDPELLGKVFENLLAAYNPETSTTARKATGSYYTPREIVDYMVNESILLYLQTKLGQTNDAGDKLRTLLSLKDEVPALTQKEVETLVNAIDSIKVIDPACGSGAFLMGILHKLVHILKKLDPRNQLWKEKQLAKLDDMQYKEHLEKIQSSPDDYGRKLALIQSCIYGVDIQPIAVQIAKLRFFISLIVEQEVDDKEPNRGILALPNLETKFVAANTLIGIERSGQLLVQDLVIEQKKKSLADVRKSHFNPQTYKTKKKYRDEDKKLRKEISDILRKNGWSDETAAKLAGWDPYDQNASAGFFDPEWMFNVKDGFDIVISNPPYNVLENAVNDQDQQHLVERVRKKTSEYIYSLGGKLNLYRLFIERGFRITRKNGAQTFIVPSTILADKNTAGLRKMFSTDGEMKFFVEIPEKTQVFENVTQAIAIFSIQKRHRNNRFFLSVNLKSKVLPPENVVEVIWKEVESISGSDLSIPLISHPSEYQLLKKIHSNKITLGKFTKIAQGDVNLTVHKKYIVDKPTRVLLVRGEHISRFRVDSSDLNKERRWIDYERMKKELNDKKNSIIAEDSSKKRIVCQNIANMGLKFRIIPAIIPPKVLVGHSAEFLYPLTAKWEIEAILGILSSQLLNWRFKKTSTNNHVNIYELENLPIPNLSLDEQNPISKLVDKILAITKDKNYPTNPQKQTKVKEYEHQIDQMVYKLYGLTEEEIKIVEGSAK